MLAAFPARAAPTPVALSAQWDTTTLLGSAPTLARLARQSSLPTALAGAPVIAPPVIVPTTPTARPATTSLCLSTQGNAFLRAQLEAT